MSDNPLKQVFRTPALHIAIPSKGRFWADGSLDMPITQELEVYPMTARDEMLLNSPDGLLNGSATSSVIQSCIPAIKDAWQTPSCDLDVILMAIRVASVGTMLEIPTKCPHCGERHDYQLNLADILHAYNKQINWDQPVELDRVSVFVRPQPYYVVNSSNMERFEQQQLIAVQQASNLSPTEKKDEFMKIFHRLTEMNLNSLSWSVESVVIKGDEPITVTDRAHISEWVDDADKKTVDKIRERINEIKEQLTVPPVTAQCTNEECLKTYTIPVVLDQSNFFG